MESEFIALVQNVGFPIAITAWFMIRTEKVISNNTATMERVNVTIQQCPKPRIPNN